MNAFRSIKRYIQKVIWPYGSEVIIRNGHLKGYRFIVTENSGWSPILGRWEPQSQDVFSQIIRPGQVVFDLGANNGIHSLLFSELVGDTGKVYAFEPLPDNIEEIKKNCALNKVSNLEIVPSAVGSYDGKIKFLLGLLNKQGSIVGIGRQSGQELEVDLITLRTFIEREKCKPDFIKIDIEGAESDALVGMGNLIKSLKPVFFIELHTREQDKKVGGIFQELNYTLYRLKYNSHNNQLGVKHLDKIQNLGEVHPHPQGVWGTILAVPNDSPLFHNN